MCVLETDDTPRHSNQKNSETFNDRNGNPKETVKYVRMLLALSNSPGYLFS
jgi:hypothetical protein